MRLQFLYVIDSEPVEDVISTAEDLFRQKDADVCIVCNSGEGKLLQYFNSNRDKIKAYRSFGSCPQNYIFLFSLSFICHGVYDAYTFIVPGTRLPENYSQVCLSNFNLFPMTSRLIFVPDNPCPELAALMNEQQRFISSGTDAHKLLMHIMMVSTNISCANIAIKTNKYSTIYGGAAALYAKPWVDAILNSLKDSAVIIGEAPVFKLPKSETALLYFLGQYRFLIDLLKMPFYKTVERVRPLMPNVLDALHAHGKYAAAFAEQVQYNTVLSTKVQALARVMMRQKESVL